MTKEGLLSILFVMVLLSVAVIAEAQQPKKVARIGLLDNSTASGSAGLAEAFRYELSKLGWIEGKNITLEYRFSEQKSERLPELAAELVRLKVDLIVVASTESALAAKSGAVAGEGTQDRLAPSAFPFRSRWRARVIPARVSVNSAMLRAKHSFQVPIR